MERGEEPGLGWMFGRFPYASTQKGEGVQVESFYLSASSPTERDTLAAQANRRKRRVDWQRVRGVEDEERVRGRREDVVDRSVRNAAFGAAVASRRQWPDGARPGFTISTRMEPTRLPRGPGPRLVFLFATLIFTFAATGLLCGAIMSDHWEEVSWNKEVLVRANVSLTWYLDGQVAMLESALGYRNHHSNKRASFLVPMHGGIWTMCLSLSDEEIRLLSQVGFSQERCINYLTPDEAHEEMRAAWQNRMQNLSISCSLVCLIILSSAVLIGFFGLCRHQISAVLVTGVMYLLAATFALFTLSIIHFKRAQDRGTRIVNGPEDGVVGGPVSRGVLKARHFTTSWSMDLGWGGVTLCALASVAWILLSKIMRFSPIAVMIA